MCLARPNGIACEEQDHHACESHRRAAQAVERAEFQEEIVAVQTQRDAVPVLADEGF